MNIHETHTGIGAAILVSKARAFFGREPTSEGGLGLLGFLCGFLVCLCVCVGVLLSK